MQASSLCEDLRLADEPPKHLVKACAFATCLLMNQYQSIMATAFGPGLSLDNPLRDG